MKFPAMPSNPSMIYNTLTWQERFVLFLVSMLFIAQPFEFADGRTIFWILTAIGTWILLFNKQIFQQAGFWQLATVLALLALPGIISFWNTHSVLETTNFTFAIPAAFAAGATMYSLLTNDKAAKILSGVIAITSLIWLLDAVVQGFIGFDLVGIHLLGGKQVTGPFNSTQMGILLAVTLPVTLKWYAKYGWFSQLSYVTLLGYVLMLTGVRTDWVTFLVAVVLFYLCLKQGRRLLLTRILPLVGVIGLAAIVASPLAREKVERLISIPTTYDGWNEKLTNRVYIYATALNMGSENLLTGAGAKAFNHAYVEYRLEGDPIEPDEYGKGGAYHAHHPWLSVFAETGMIGVVSLVGSVLLLIVATARSSRGLNFYYYPWFLSYVLILNPINSMLPLFEMWWFPVVLLVIVSHITDLERTKTTVTLGT